MVERQTKKKTTTKKPTVRNTTAKPTSPRKKTTVKRTVKRKVKRKGIKNFQQFKQLFFEKLGFITFFVIVLLFLLMMFITQWQRSMNQGVEYPDNDADYQTRVSFVEEISPIAQKLQRKYGIFASVSMAQAMLESQFGQSGLAADYYNLFGVKTDSADPNGVDLATAEFVDNEWIEITDRFKVYPDWEASMEAHAQLLVNGTSWDPEFYALVKEGSTPQEQAEGLQQSGYATDPDYADKLISMMEEWDLYQYNQPSDDPSETTMVE